MAKVIRSTLVERLWRLTERTPGGCWTWLGLVTNRGYGRITLRENGHQRVAAVHRVAYELMVEPIPDGLVLDHLCRNRACINPAHLEPVTPRENTRRGQSPHLLLHKSGLCAKGHPTRWNGKRSICPTCATRYTREYRRRQRAAGVPRSARK